MRVNIHKYRAFSIEVMVAILVLQTNPLGVELFFSYAGAHNPERATPILGLCQDGVFTDQFIFRHRISTMSMSVFEV